MNTDDKMVKHLKTLLKVAEKHGLSKLTVNDGPFSISFEFGEKKVLTRNKTTPLSRQDKEKLQKFRERANIDEMKLTDPLAYEEAVANGQLTDELEA